MSSITCGNCKRTHFSVEQVRACYQRGNIRSPRPADPKPIETEHIWRAPSSESLSTVLQIQGLSDVPDGTYTVAHPDEGTHSTWRIRTQRNGGSFLKGKRILSRLIGSNNDSDYMGVAHLDGDKVIAWRAHHTMVAQGEDDLRTIAGDPKASAKAYALHSGNCWACGRRLTVPASIAAGMGPRCASRVGW